MMLSSSHPGTKYSAHVKVMTPNNSDVTGTIRKDKGEILEKVPELFRFAYTS
jgi:hypothetical protein